MGTEQEIYRRIKLLGEGSFGKAYLAESLIDKSLCVIKQVDLTQMKPDERSETIKEARILEALKHPNIVKFKEVYKTKKGRLCIVMDYADGGDLSQKIKDAGNVYIPEAQILDWFTQICLALKHVHDRKIIHRDLKSQNIFLTKEGIIKMGDFGIARVLNHTREKCKTMVGTPYYLSPEIIDSRDYSFKTDIWSLGVILYELCALKPPFNAESLHGLALKIVRGSYPPIPERYSNEVRNLVRSLLNVDPQRRPTIHEVLKMPVIVNRIRSVLSESIRNVEFSHTILHKQNFVNRNLEIPYDDDIARNKNNNLKEVQSQPTRIGYLQIQQQPIIKPRYQPSQYQQPAQNNNVYPASYLPQVNQQEKYSPYQQRYNNILKKDNNSKPVSPINRAVENSNLNNNNRDKSPIMGRYFPQVSPHAPQPLQEQQNNNRIYNREPQPTPLNVMNLQPPSKSPIQQRIQSAHDDLKRLPSNPSSHQSQPQGIKEENQSEKQQQPPQPQPLINHHSTPQLEDANRMKESHQILKEIRKDKKQEEREKMKQDIAIKRQQLSKENDEVQIEWMNVNNLIEDDANKILAELEDIVNDGNKSQVLEVSDVNELLPNPNSTNDVSDRDDEDSLVDDDLSRQVDHVDQIRKILEEQMGVEALSKCRAGIVNWEDSVKQAVDDENLALVLLLDAMESLNMSNLQE